MNKILIITKRELRLFFDSLIAYMMIIIFLGFSGFFTWLNSQGNVFLMGQAILQVFFSIAFWTFFFFIPALTMRLLAEENRSGTIELLITKPISYWQIIIGKYFATLILIIIALALTIPYYITVANLGKVDHGTVICGYLGLLLMSATYISVGIFASSISNNQIVALLIALAIGICFHIIFDMLAESFGGGIFGKLFHYLDLKSHYETLTRGVLDTKDLIYFFSIIIISLISSEIILSRKNA